MSFIFRLSPDLLGESCLYKEVDTYHTYYFRILYISSVLFLFFISSKGAIIFWSYICKYLLGMSLICSVKIVLFFSEKSIGIAIRINVL